MQRMETRPYFSLEATVAAHENLSKRELEVLRCLASGMSNQEIAQAIVITVGTVKRHTNNIYGKLNVRNRLQAVIYAQKHNMLPTLHKG
jgi:ATP/maltotriose-dependent transcriptional regulator MalT